MISPTFRILLSCAITPAIVVAADPQTDLCSKALLSRSSWAFEASLSHRDGVENYRVIGFDSTTRAWYLIQYGTPAGVDHAGRSMSGGPSGLEYSKPVEGGVRQDAAFIEQFIAPTTFLAGLCSQNATAITVTLEDSGSYICKAALLASSRRTTAIGLPPGMKGQIASITVWVDHTGLPSRIQRFADGPIESFDYEPSSLTKIPIARTADNGAWKLESLTWLTTNDPRFTLEGLRKRAAQPDTRPRKPEPPPSSPEERARAEAESLKSAIAAGIVSQSTLSSYQWPLVITGSLLVAIGVVAYVRSRRN